MRHYKFLLGFLLVSCQGALAAVPSDRTGFFINLITPNPPKATVVLTDPLGKRTGILEFDAKANEKTGFAEIPNSSAVYEGSPGDDLTGEFIPTGAVDIEVNSAVATGLYRLTVYGIQRSTYVLRVNSRDSAGNIAFVINDLAGAISPGEAQEFIFNYSSVPGSTTTVTKLVTFASLRQSLRTWHELAQVGGAKFVAKLDKTLAQGETAAAKGKKTDAVEKLRKFVRKIKKAFKGDNDDEPDEDHKERFVSELAFRSLKDDAEALIRSLDGKPGKGGHDD